MLTLLAMALAAPPAPVAWIPGEATYHLAVADDVVRVELRYRFDAVGGDYEDVRLVGPGLAIEEAPAGATVAADGLHLQLGPGLPREVTVRGRLLAPGHDLRLPVLRATRQRVEVDAPGLTTTVDGATGPWLAPTDVLAARWEPTVPKAPSAATRIHAEVATGAWGADRTLALHAVVRWNVVRGAVSELRLGVAGLDEVEPTGVGLASWRREGDTLILLTKTEVKGRFSIDLRARSSLPAGAQVPAPLPVADRVESWWVLGKSDEGELIPDGGESIARRELPLWARGLTETTQLAAWHVSAPTLTYARYDAVEGPGTVVSRARHEVVSNEDGRVFVRSTLRVRNERRQYLHVSPPAGFSALGARVSGQPVTVLTDGAGGLYVPLEKSVETVRGLVTFPVELLWVAETTPFARRGAWTLTLPAVDAPVQRVEWDVHLPRDYRAPGRQGQPLADVSTEVESSVLQALNAYKQNDFDAAQEWLDHARAQGGEDEDSAALQANLDVLNRKDSAEDGNARRIRDLAGAKNTELAAQQAVAEADAEKALLSGDYRKADELNRFVEESAKKLAMTEQRESGEQTEKLQKAKVRAAKLEEKAVETRSFSGAVTGSATSGSHGAGKLAPKTDPTSTPTSATTSTPNGAPDDLKTPDVAEPAVVYEAPTEIDFDGIVADTPMPVTVEPAPAARAPMAGLIQRRTEFEFDDEEMIGELVQPELDEAPPEAPARDAKAERGRVAENKPPPIQLEAHAAPITLALPLDGARVTNSQDLLAAGALPTFTVIYRGTR